MNHVNEVTVDSLYILVIVLISEHGADCEVSCVVFFLIPCSNVNRYYTLFI